MRQLLQPHRGTGRPFGAVLNEWCDRGRSARGAEWSRRQKNDTRSRLDHRIIPTLGEIRLADLTSVDIENAYDAGAGTD